MMDHQSNVENAWNKATVKLPASLSSRWWESICQHYSESQRHYHTLQHISHMLHLIQEHGQNLPSQQTLTYAAIFHDIIYDPKAPDNEEKSASLFKQFAEESELQPEISSAVIEWILLTKQHTTDVHSQPGVYGTSELHYFLDCDMAILGSSEKEYDKYAAQIRQEYIQIPEEHYKRKRAQVLKEFLKTVNIYATAEFRTAYENIARDNIQKEIDRLEKQN